MGRDAWPNGSFMLDPTGFTSIGNGRNEGCGWITETLERESMEFWDKRED
jgi:hypothetical protein